jgi:NAD(P)-dependent dehydrogenase (short-subunit alcohol dehydrogenase family)
LNSRPNWRVVSGRGFDRETANVVPARGRRHTRSADAVADINAKAVFFASQAVLLTMIPQKRGAIVSLASMTS